MSIKAVLITESATPHYFIRSEDWTHEGDPAAGPTRMLAAYSFAGDYLGDPDHAEQLVREHGIIHFEKTDPEHSVCSIGFSLRDQKWYGWSHRAIYGYGIGDVVESGSVPTEHGWTEEYAAAHPEEVRAVPAGFEVKTFDDAKRVAIAFAMSVS